MKQLITALSFILLVLPVLALAADEDSQDKGIHLSVFMHPRPGEAFIYRGSNGMEMARIGEKWNNATNTLAFKETVSMLVPSDMGGERMSTTHDLIFALRGNDLIRDADFQRDIILSSRTNGWGNRVDTPEGPRTMRCGITDTTYEVIKGKERIVVSVTCELVATGKTRKMEYRMAQGIGLYFREEDGYILRLVE